MKGLKDKKKELVFGVLVYPSPLFHIKKNTFRVFLRLISFLGGRGDINDLKEKT